MASVFKRGRDKGKRRSFWYFSFDDYTGKRRTLKGFTDKGATEDLAAKMEREAMLRRKGLIDPEDERRAKAQRRPIEEHLKEFERSLESNTPKHVKLTMTRIRRIINAADITMSAHINVDKVAACLRELKRKEKFGHRTYNHYVQAIDGFCNWLVATGRLDRNPLIGLERLNTEVDVRHKRRALTPDEFAALVQSARDSNEKVQDYAGEQRARVYLLSYMTGLRRKELASLTPRSFDLVAKQPILTVEAASSKRRRLDVLPLHPELVPMLKEWLKGHPEDQPLFPRLDRKKTWLMVKKDLERVEIEYETPDGIADFHAAGRHTHVTELLRSGATLPEARELARHSDVRLTMKYTHIGLQDQAKALAALKLPKPAAKKSKNAKKESWQRYGSGTRRAQRQNTSSSGTDENGEDEPTQIKNPRQSEGYDTNSQPKSLFGTEVDEWRRRESNRWGRSLQRSMCSRVTTFRRNAVHAGATQQRHRVSMRGGMLA